MWQLKDLDLQNPQSHSRRSQATGGLQKNSWDPGNFHGVALGGGGGASVLDLGKGDSFSAPRLPLPCVQTVLVGTEVNEMSGVTPVFRTCTLRRPGH